MPFFYAISLFFQAICEGPNKARDEQSMGLTDFETNIPINSTFPKQALIFMCLHHKSFENTVGKGKIARNQQFFLFPQCFLAIHSLASFLPFLSNLKLLSANSFSLEELKICRLGKS